MKAARTWRQSTAAAKREIRQPTKATRLRMCKEFVREMLGILVSKSGSAQESWAKTPAEHKHKGVPPAGSVAYWSPNHVALAVENGEVVSTDIERSGRVDQVPWDLISEKWHMTYLGWADWLDGRDLDVATVPPPAPPKPPAPKPPAQKTYVVKSGDNLTAIAARFDTTVAELARINKIADPDRIQVGQRLKLP